MNLPVKLKPPLELLHPARAEHEVCVVEALFWLRQWAPQRFDLGAEAQLPLFRWQGQGLVHVSVRPHDRPVDQSINQLINRSTD